MLSFLLPFIKDLNKLQQDEVEFETQENGMHKVAYLAISEYLRGPFFHLTLHSALMNRGSQSS